ncbi:MAG: ATP-binding protein [Alphaproteobacteria bacterium]|uniref:ATP-binding protein n=1 Tax=Candidatus Nitrobium versatile TaxID=2884831 RepID=A0A953M122_9BACT|nr:ATP-binding protein [Candidatus Nitrobium versatile]
MDYKRPLVKDLVSSLKKKLPVFQALIGPRQVGKTTIAEHVVNELSYPSVYASADSPLPPGPEWVETQWRRAELEAQRAKQPVVLVLDEIQKVRGWSESLKLLWDRARREGKDIRLLVLGSSALLLQEGLTESLAGRFFLTRCPHWSFFECASAFDWDLNTWLYFGGYPGAAVFAQEESQWKRYVTDSLIETVLARDVLQMQKVAKPALLRHLFALSAIFPARILSYNKMLGQLQDAGNTTTLAHYLRLLESAFLVSGLELFSQGQVRKRGSSPKLILWNNALINALSSKTFKETIGDASWWGRLVENAVGAHLCNSLSGTSYELTYWRDGDKEVDFVVTKGSSLWAVEVKSGRSGKMSGMDEFRRKYPGAKSLLVGAEGIPLESFFSESAAVWLEG